jgi:hypothetical protein
MPVGGMDRMHILETSKQYFSDPHMLPVADQARVLRVAGNTQRGGGVHGADT